MPVSLPLNKNKRDDGELSDGIRTTVWTLPIRTVGRDLSDDDWEEIDPNVIRCWEACAKIYRNVEIECHGTRKIMFDFSGAIARARSQFEIYRRIYIEKDGNAVNEFEHSPVDINITCLQESGQVHREDYRSESLIEYLIYEIFLVANIAMPGSCDFYGTKLEKKFPVLSTGRTYGGTPLNLRSFLCEAALYEAADRPWLKLKYVEPDVVLKGLQLVCGRFQMVPRNDVSKAIFALLHLCNNEVSPISVIWIFYALESLYQCRPGENFLALYSRIILVLDIKEPKHKKSLKKDLRRLYDIRSAIVHGGATVVHPMDDETLDEGARGVAWEFVKASEFGSALILRTLQTVILNEWTSLSFEERIASAN